MTNAKPEMWELKSAKLKNGDFSASYKYIL